MDSKKYNLAEIAKINETNYSLKENWAIIQYLDTGSVNKGYIESVKHLRTRKDKIPSRARRKVKANSVIYSMVRPDQEHYALLENPPTNMLVSTGFAVIDAIASVVTPEYLYYVLIHPNTTAHFQTLAEQSASTYPTLSYDDLAKFEVNVPDFPDQLAISTILRPLDRKIAINQRTNDYLVEMCDAVFLHSFGKIEDNAVLSDIATITMGQSPSGKSYNEVGDGTVFYQGRREFGWRFPTRRLFTTEPKRMANKDDVLMSVRAPVGDLNVASEDCCIGRGLAAIHSQYPSYCLYLMRSLRRKLDVYNGEGTVFGSINGRSLRDLAIGLPSTDAIRAFEAFARPIDESIRTNAMEELTLANLCDTLLPKLMSGEIDVSQVDLPTPPNNHLSSD